MRDEILSGANVSGDAEDITMIDVYIHPHSIIDKPKKNVDSRESFFNPVRIFYLLVPRAIQGRGQV